MSKIYRHMIIAGSGTMGRSMAQIFASFGHKVTLYDISTENLDKARQLITQSVATMVEAGEMSREQSLQTLTNLAFTDQTDCFASAEIVIENIFEDLEVKKKFYAQISALVPDEAVLASNTSGLSINAMAQAVKNPQRFIGMHWFNPPHLVLLIEIIRNDHTDEATAQAIYDLSLAIGRKPVLVQKDVPGFVANRLQVALLREALDLVEQGVISPQGIDDIMKYGLGFRLACVGPLEVADLGGLDIWQHVADYLYPDLCQSQQVSPLLSRHVQSGELGVKSGRGFYDYSGNKAQETIRERDRKMIAIFNALYKNRE